MGEAVAVDLLLVVLVGFDGEGGGEVVCVLVNIMWYLGRWCV